MIRSGGEEVPGRKVKKLLFDFHQKIYIKADDDDDDDDEFPLYEKKKKMLIFDDTLSYTNTRNDFSFTRYVRTDSINTSNTSINRATVSYQQNRESRISWDE